MQPEQKAREHIDELLHYAGWDVQDRDAMNLFDPAKPGVAVREAHLKTGFADYLLFVEGKVLGVVEAKRVGRAVEWRGGAVGKVCGGVEAADAGVATGAAAAVSV